MEINISIGARLREVRESMGLSQTEFAEIAAKAGVPGATRQSQAKYEKGIAAPSSGYLAAIAAAGADVLYILTGLSPPIASASEASLSRRQVALLDNYENTDEAGKKIIEATASAAAQQIKPMKKSG